MTTKELDRYMLKLVLAVGLVILAVLGARNYYDRHPDVVVHREQLRRLDRQHEEDMRRRKAEQDKFFADFEANR